MRKAEEWNVFFEDNHRYADLINGVMCSGVQFVKDTDLSEADPTARKKSRDILRRVALGVNFAIVGLEHQEELDYEMPLRNMHYDVARYQNQAANIRKEVRENPKGLKSGEYMYGFKQESKLNPLVTLVLYAGEEEWDGPNCLHDIIDFTDIPESFKDFVSDYKINIISIRDFENTDVFQTDVKQVFDFIRCSNDKKKLLDLVQNDIYFQEMDEEAFDVVTKYTKSKELVRAKEYVIQGGKNNMCKAIRDLMDDSRAEGREETLLESARNLLDVLSDEVISEKIGIPLETVQKMRIDMEVRPA